MEELLGSEFPEIERAAFLQVRDVITHCAGADRRPQLIVLDAWLGSHTGLASLQALKGDPVTRSIPVVVFDGSDTPEDIEEAYRAQAAAYLQKPASLTELTDTLRTMVTYWRAVRSMSWDEARRSVGTPGSGE